MAKEKGSPSKGLVLGPVAIIIVLAVLLVAVAVKANANATAGSESLNSNITYHNLTLLNISDTFTLSKFSISLNTTFDSGASRSPFHIVNFELPYNVVYIHITGAVFGSGNLSAAILTPLEYGELLQKYQDANSTAVAFGNQSYITAEVSQIVGSTGHFWNGGILAPTSNPSSSVINVIFVGPYPTNVAQIPANQVGAYVGVAPYMLHTPIYETESEARSYDCNQQMGYNPPNIYECAWDYQAPDFSLVFFNGNTLSNETVAVTKSIMVTYATVN